MTAFITVKSAPEVEAKLWQLPVPDEGRPSHYSYRPPAALDPGQALLSLTKDPHSSSHSLFRDQQREQPWTSTSDLDDGEKCFPSHNGITGALYTAFCGHHPVALSPDMFQYMIMQGFTKFIDKDPEGFRQFFVTHEGKEVIAVQNDALLSSPRDAETWAPTVMGIAEQLRQRTHPGLAATALHQYSTTGAVQSAARAVALADAMKHYFEYRCYTMCGIPHVQFMGTPDDYGKLLSDARDAAAAVSHPEVTEWMNEEVLPGLDSLNNAVRNPEAPASVEFMNSIYKYHSARGSGGVSTISGWITNFIPFTGQGHRSKGRMEPDDIPRAVSSAPLAWHVGASKYDMKLAAGYPGFAWSETMKAIVPVASWAVLGDASGTFP